MDIETKPKGYLHKKEKSADVYTNFKSTDPSPSFKLGLTPLTDFEDD